MPLAVVLAEPNDRGALLVARALRQRGVELALVAADQLLLAPLWSHDPLGSSRIVLGNGIELSDRTVGVVFCRLCGIDPPQFRRAAARDRAYAQEEFHALILSWLVGLGERVRNRPHPASLVGMQCSRLEDLLRSAQRTGSPHGFAAASHARHLPSGGGMVGDYRPWGDIGAGGDGDTGAVLVGGPALRLPAAADGRRWRVTVIGDRLFGADPPSEARSLALRVARERGLSFASVELFGLAGGDFGHGMVDPLPALGDDEQVEAAADLLARAMAGQAA